MPKLSNITPEYYDITADEGKFWITDKTTGEVHTFLAFMAYEVLGKSAMVETLKAVYFALRLKADSPKDELIEKIAGLLKAVKAFPKEPESPE